MQEKVVNIPIFYGKIRIIQCDELSELVDRFDLPELLGYDAICFRDISSNGFITYVLAFEQKSATPKNIAHEALHCVNYIFDDRHMKYDTDNDETQCYLLGWLVEKLHKHLKVT